MRVHILSIDYVQVTSGVAIQITSKWSFVDVKNNEHISKNDDDEIIETTTWITRFIDVKTMNIHQKMVILIEKTMKPCSKAVVLLL